MKCLNNQSIYKTGLFTFFCLIIFVTAISFTYGNTERDIYKYYTININLFSFEPNQPLDSYKWYGSGNSGDGGSVGLACGDKLRDFRVNIVTRNSSGRFKANIAVVPGKNDSETKPNSFDVDFTDLKPKSFELAKNKDGRIYILNLTPSITVSDNRPKRADNTAFNIDKWVLTDSMVIFNDSLYAGKIGCAGGPLAYVSYPGIAKVEFALEPFRGAKLLGTLKDGRIQIHSEDGQSLDIYSVRNGTYEMQLPGGPYEVWVRWQKLPGEAKFEIPPKEEWIRMVKSRFAEMGNTPPTDEELDKGYEKIKYEKHLPLSGGVGPIREADKL